MFVDHHKSDRRLILFFVVLLLLIDVVAAACSKDKHGTVTNEESQHPINLDRILTLIDEAETLPPLFPFRWQDYLGYARMVACRGWWNRRWGDSSAYLYTSTGVPGETRHFICISYSLWWGDRQQFIEYAKETTTSFESLGH
jgi:hypothetical protein